MIDRKEIEAALDDHRLIVKCVGGWFLARRDRLESKTVEMGDGLWLVRIRAKKSALGFITNKDDNAGGRPFRILEAT